MQHKLVGTKKENPMVKMWLHIPKECDPGGRCLVKGCNAINDDM